MELDKCGKNLKEALAKKGLTQKAFNELLSDTNSVGSVGYWVRGQEPVPKRYRECVARILEISESEFVPTIGYVHLFYYSDLKLEGKSTWACKIGSTAQPVCSRVKEQIREWGYKGKYEVPMILRVPFGQEHGWEKMIHGVLMLRGKWLDKDKAELKGLKGNEWFDTSPGEVEGIYKSIKEFKNGYFR